MRVVFAGKCMWLENPVTGGDRYMIEFHRALLSKGVKVDWVREPRFPLRGRFTLPLANAWSLSMNAWYAARRNEFAQSIVFQDYSSRTRLFASNRAIRGACGSRIVSLVQGFYHSITHNSVLRTLETRMARSYMRSLDLVLANSHSTAREAVELGADRSRIRVVHPGLDDVFLKIDPHGKRTRGKPVRLLFVGGQCKPVKGLEYLVSAIAALGNRDVTLTLVGETTGPHFAGYVSGLKTKCAALGIEDKVKFTGLLGSTDSLISLYRESDIFVLPSLWEGFGLAALEAMCFGLPVVGTNAGGITEVVDHEATGLLVAPRDSRALAGALGTLIDNEPLWRGMSAASALRAKALRRDWKAVGLECLGHVEGLWNGDAGQEGRWTIQ